MEFMADAKRADIRAWMPEARSVLMCGFYYRLEAPGTPEAPPAGKGRLARYARFSDYHDELKKRMRIIAAWFNETCPGERAVVFTDDSPILEKLYAYYAGLGWIGKNTMLISPELGSYFLLSGIALTVELPADRAIPDHCESCRLCLDACPTQAFPAERVLDAGRCVAYHTIENKDAVPEWIREGVGTRVFGCDDCQDACPFNSRARAPAPALPAALPADLDLEALAEMPAREFNALFKGTPVHRSRRRRLARNALLAMGNARDPRNRPVLERLLDHPDEVLREQAAWSLSRLRPT